MKKTSPKKLRLNKETIKVLDVKTGVKAGGKNPTISHCIGRASCAVPLEPLE
jgi:hypothetical protein